MLRSPRWPGAALLASAALRSDPGSPTPGDALPLARGQHPGSMALLQPLPLPCFPDINECEHRNHTCTLQQTCYNLQGGFKCIDPIRCEEPYIQISDKYVGASPGKREGPGSGGCQGGGKENAPVRGLDPGLPSPRPHTQHPVLHHSPTHTRATGSFLELTEREESLRTFFPFDHAALETQDSGFGFSDVLCVRPARGQVRVQPPLSGLGWPEGLAFQPAPGEMDSLPGLCCEQWGAGEVTRKFLAPGT